MSQPRKGSQFRSISERFSMRRFYTTEYFQEPHRSQSRKLAKEKKMSGALPVDPMDIDSGSTVRHSTRNEHHEGTFLEDEKLEEQYELVNRDLSMYTHPNEPLERPAESSSVQQNESQTQSGKEEKQTSTAVAQGASNALHRNNAEQADLPQTKMEKTEGPDIQLQMQQLHDEYSGQMEDLRSKFTNLEHSVLRPTESQQPGEDLGSTNDLGRKDDERILNLEKTRREMEEQIHNLLNAQEVSLKHQSEIEARYRNALNQIEKERRAREESELNSRTEVTTMRGAYQKEKERAQKLMKTMAEMQSADPFKMDNTSITSRVKELRYDIKNWARAQRLLPSLPAQGIISTYTNRALGGKERGPNYEFLKDTTPMFQEYTESPQELKWVLQAYVWKRIVDLVFNDDLWAGTRRHIDGEESDFKLQTGYRQMKLRLKPDEDASQEYISQFHEWRSTSARILDQRISPARRKYTMEMIREDIIRPIIRAADSMEQEIRNIEDLETLIESAMRLGATMAQQKASFSFEFASLASYGKQEFQPQHMTDPFPPQQYDPRSHFRAVWLNLAPRLMKHGSSEGTNFDSCVQLLEGEVETKVVPRKFGVRRQVMN